MGLNRYDTQLGDKITRQGSNIVAIPLGNYAT